MKLNYLIPSIAMSLLIYGCNATNTQEKSKYNKISKPYLGQQPPELTAKIFAPGLVSSEHKDAGAFFSPDMTEFFFTRNPKNSRDWSLMSYKFDGKKWNPSDPVPRVGRPFISPDGKIMHLGKKFRERTNDGWSEIKSLGDDYEKTRIMRLTSSNSGTFVFDEATRDGKGILRYSLLADGKRQAPQPLPKTINTGTWNAHPFIAPDESYILWDGERETGFGDNDIYVSFKQEDGSWGEAINLGEKVNTSAQENGPYVSPDGKYLFFNSNSAPDNRDIFWVDANILEELKNSEQNKPVSESEFPTFEGAYLGQKPPGLKAERFAPGLVSKQNWELEGVFAPGMKEFYYTIDRSQTKSGAGKKFSPTVIGYRLEDKIWRKYIEFPRTGEIVFSHDGNRMFMAEGYRERVGDGWSKRKSLGPMFDRKDYGIMRLSSSKTGTYVFDDYKSKDLIRISTIENGIRQKPKAMGTNINTGKWTAHPFIAADESYVIWDSEREGGFGNSDLYISFKQPNGTWGKAINMGPEINSDNSDFYASVTPDGKYILFNRTIDKETRDIDIYWADAKIIEQLRPQ